MGLDIGVVKISYLDRPEQPMYDFLWQLVLDAPSELEREYWGGLWEGNAFIEIFKSSLVSKANNYIQREKLPQEDADKLIKWVDDLPWLGDTIMLHLNW